MTMSFSGRCLKYTIFVFNSMFFIMGIVCVALGCWLIFDHNALTTLAEAAEQMSNSVSSSTSEEMRLWVAKWRAIRYLGIGFALGGALIIGIAMLGCIGATKEWRPLLICYAFLLMVILTLQLIIVIYAAINQGVLERKLKSSLRHSLQQYKPVTNTQKPGSAFKYAWDSVMINMKCCGVDSVDKDFVQSGWYRLSDKRTPFPPACCQTVGPDDKTVQRCRPEQRYDIGCYDLIRNQIVAKHGVVIGVAVGIAVVQMFGIIMAFCLCNSISNEVDRLEAEQY